MLEYIFFDRRPWQRFIDFLIGLGLEPQAAEEQQGYLVRLPEETDDALMEEIEQCYDEMLDLNERLYHQQQGAAQVHRAGISVNLSDGRSVQAAVDPALLNRVLEVLSADELGQLVSAVVDAVESPDERPFCQRDD